MSANDEQKEGGTPSLFERLGGMEGLTAFVGDICDCHMANPRIKHHFGKFVGNAEATAKFKEHATQYFSTGTGGPALYKGKGMVELHGAMNITDSDFMAVLDDCLLVMDKPEHKLDDATKKEVLWVLMSFRHTIIRNGQRLDDDGKLKTLAQFNEKYGDAAKQKWHNARTTG